MKLKKADKVIVILSITFCIVSSGAYLLFEELGIIIGLGLLVFVLMKYQNYNKNLIYNDLQRVKNDYYQLESLINIYQIIEVGKPIPALRKFAASPDFMRELFKIIDTHQPKVILELGSGVSSILIGYLLKQRQEGKLITIDHDEKFGSQTMANVRYHGLEDVVEVRIAPFRSYTLNQEKYIWYDEDLLTLEQKIDLLIVDGPPVFEEFVSRYPALPLLIDRMAEGSLTIMDDASRTTEKEIKKRWLKEFPHLCETSIETEKGMAILSRQKPPSL